MRNLFHLSINVPPCFPLASSAPLHEGDSQGRQLLQLRKAVFLGED